MAKFKVTAPDGKSYEVTAPEGATQDQVLAYAKEHYGSHEAAPAAPKPPENPALPEARRKVGGDVEGADAGEILGLTEGVTLGFGDEISHPLDKASAMVANIARKAMGKKEPYTSDQYADAMQEARTETLTKLGNEHPVKKGASEFLGGMMIPGLGEANKALKGLGMTSGLGRAATLGAGLGGAAAAGNSDGDVVNRAKAVPGGAGLGGITGGLLHGGAGLAGRLGSGFSEAGSRIGQGLSELLDIGSGKPHEITPKRLASGEKKGVQYVADLAKKLDPTGQKLAASGAEKAGKPITAAEALGRPAQTQLKVLGRRSGKTPDELSAQLSQRQREASDRVVSDFHEITGIDPEAARGDLKAQTDALRAKADPLYKKWWEHKDVTSPVLQDLLKTHSIKEALGHAKAILSDEHEEAYKLGLDQSPVPLMRRSFEGKIVPILQDGKPIMVPREEAFAYAKSLGFSHPAEAEDTEKLVPTAKGWDYVKRGLDESLEKYRDKTTGRLNTSSPKARALIKVRRELSDELGNPERRWGEDAKAAFDAGGDPIRQEEAFGDAKKLLSNNTRGHQFDQVLARYTPAQKEALKAGVVSEVREAAQAGRQRLRELLTDSTILKFQHIFGPEQADKLVERLTMESDMAKTGARMAPGVGSDTSETLLGAAEQNSGMQDAARAVKSLARGKWVESLAHVLSAPLVGAYRGAQAPIDEASRDMAGALLRKSPSELAKVLEKHGASKEEAEKAIQLLRARGAFAVRLMQPAVSASAGRAAARRDEDN